MEHRNHRVLDLSWSIRLVGRHLGRIPDLPVVVEASWIAVDDEVCGVVHSHSVAEGVEEVGEGRWEVGWWHGWDNGRSGVG